MKRIFSTAVLLILVALPAFAGGVSGIQDWDPAFWLGPLVVGLVINAQSIAGLYKSFNTLFNQAMAAATPRYTKIAMVVPSSTKSNGYAWLGAWPKMREWLGDRQLHKLEAFDYEIKNKDWETTIEIDRNDIEDDTYGVYRPLFTAMGGSSQMHPDELVFGLLNNGFAKKGYDGKNFFDTTHASGSNKGTGVLNAANYAKAKAALDRVKDSKGNPLFTGNERDILVTGPELEEAARQLLNNDYVAVAGAGMQNNVWKGSADYEKTPQITSATAWFLVRTFNGLLPLIFQKRRELQFISKDNPESSDITFMKKKYIYGADARYNAGYGLHQLAYGSDGTV